MRSRLNEEGLPRLWVSTKHLDRIAVPAQSRAKAPLPSHLPVHPYLRLLWPFFTTPRKSPCSFGLSPTTGNPGSPTYRGLIGGLLSLQSYTSQSLKAHLIHLPTLSPFFSISPFWEDNFDWTETFPISQLKFFYDLICSNHEQISLLWLSFNMPPPRQHLMSSMWAWSSLSSQWWTPELPVSTCQCWDYRHTTLSGFVSVL